MKRTVVSHGLAALALAAASLAAPVAHAASYTLNVFGTILETTNVDGVSPPPGAPGPYSLSLFVDTGNAQADNSAPINTLQPPDYSAFIQSQTGCPRLSPTGCWVAPREAVPHVITGYSLVTQIGVFQPRSLGNRVTRVQGIASSSSVALFLVSDQDLFSPTGRNADVSVLRDRSLNLAFQTSPALVFGQDVRDVPNVEALTSGLLSFQNLERIGTTSSLMVLSGTVDRVEISAVPEPGTVGLLGAGVVALLAVARRRHTRG